MPAASHLLQGLVCGDRHVERPELEARIAKAAGGFTQLGVGRGDCIAILMRNDTIFVEASLAAVTLGAYAVPINWHFKADEVGYVLRDCAAKVLVGHADLLATLADAIPPGVAVIAVTPPADVVHAYRIAGPVTAMPGAMDWDAWIAGAAPYQGPAVPPTAAMIYTSGTTGRPKGVRRTPATPEQERQIAQSRKLLYDLTPDARTLLPGPLYHSAPNGFALRAVRATELLVLMARFDPEDLLRLIERHRITTIFMVPVMFVRLMQLPEATRRRYDLSSLRFIMHAAAPCPPDVKREMIGWWGPIIWEFYGGTEFGAITMVSSADWLAKPGSVGRAMPGATISIQDDEGRELRQGEIGEVFTRLAFYPDFTYHNAPEKRAEVERAGFVTGGDMGYLDPDGYLFLCDRKRDMVISGGVNIYPAEIEAVALALPGVKDCAVFGIPDAEFGEALMAMVEPMPGTNLSLDDVRTHLAVRLAGYKVPRRIEIRADLPREDSGKIFKRHLRDPFWASAGRKI